MRFLFLLILPSVIFTKVKLGIDCFFEEYGKAFQGKKIALVLNQTSIDGKGTPSLNRFIKQAHNYPIHLLFAPEHGIKGNSYAWEYIEHGSHKSIELFSLHGKHRRPTKEILSKVDLVIYDIQSIGTRSYTYETTLFYIMEEAAKAGVEVVVLDRPNPMGGLVVDGPLLDEGYRSFIGYIAVPYCHGMTIGELALLFNEEYKVGCDLTVVPMKGWSREMTFDKTGLAWIPPSPHIPEADTPFYYASTGILGELKGLNIGVGYTLPFKIVGSPWLGSENFVHHLNVQKLPGVTFHSFHFKPFFGLFKNKDCAGFYIQITDRSSYLPVTTQYLILGLLKSLYPKEFASFTKGKGKRLFEKAAGNKKILQILEKEKYPFWKIKESIKDDVTRFLPVRKKYLLYK